MTLTQLRTFALVARLGSLRAAAAELGVSEPAVSAALSALRTDLADPLFVRAGGGIELTPGGRALAAHAREIVGLADRARREVADAGSAVGRLRVLSTAACEEHGAGALIDAFTARVPGTAVDVVRTSAAELAEALAEDDGDLTLGARPAAQPGQLLECVPFLRWQRVVVAGPRHRLAGEPGPVPVTALVGERWLGGPAGWEPGSEEQRWSAAARDPFQPERMDSESDALAAVRAGSGLLLALAHVVRDQLRGGALVRVPVAGTPVPGMWWASVPGRRSSPAARALQRFLTTPDATTALFGRDPVKQRRDRPTVRVALWS
ncbi:MAG: LysR family transcriptional regulator [Modestobacter sp.]|jgi:DNA-binding transcriptional LysR family regulator|nr:LysR family transcriptional regulator [Modestobacter sp.]